MKVRLYILLIGWMLALGACRTDGGDIGYLYGQWALRAYTIDGEKADVDLTQYYLSFQGRIVFITETESYNHYDTTLGTWEQDGETLKLDFTHSMILPATGETLAFDPPEALGIPGREVTDMHIDKLTSRELVIQFTDSLGQVKRYQWEKLK